MWACSRARLPASIFETVFLCCAARGAERDNFAVLKRLTTIALRHRLSCTARPLIALACSPKNVETVQLMLMASHTHLTHPSE